MSERVAAGASEPVGAYLALMNDRTLRANHDGQLSLFQEEGTLPVPDWRGRTPPEMRSDAPEGYRLDLSGEEPLYVDDDGASPCTSDPDHEFDEDDASFAGDDDGGVDEYEGDDVGSLDEEDEDDGEGWSAPREWAPYCGDTIGMSGTIRRPASRLGALWISAGGGGRAIDRDERNTNVFRVVPLAEYRSPHPDLPLHYREHFALPEDHPFRYGYEGVIVTWQKKPHVLTDEHMVFRHPYVPHPQGRGHIPDPEWFPNDEDAVRSDRNPWRDDPGAWQPIRRLL